METPIHKNKWFQLGSVAAVAFAGGSIGGYILGKRQVSRVIVEETEEFQLTLLDNNGRVITTYSENDPEVQDLVNEELDEQEMQFNVTPTSDQTGLRLVQPTMVQPEEPEVVRVNVFAREEDDDWNWEMELQSRHQDIPYVIHQEEFVADDFGFRQETLTYYVSDDIMADPADTPIYDYQGLMGELKFGHGSKDPNVVYIRNEKIHMEWEVLRHDGSFSVEVLGLDMEKETEEELKHSYRSPQKFRRSD